MVRKLVELYKVPLLLSLTLTIVLIAIKIDPKVYPITSLVVGILLGTFFLDLDYLLYAMFIEPTADFSITLMGYLKHGDLKNALSYIYHHKDDIAEKSLNSALFQIVLGGLALLVTASNTNNLIKGLVIATFLNSIYRFSEHYFENKGDKWFWVFKNKPTKQGMQFYAIGLILVLILAIRMF